jgi:hypothetical protein
MTIKFNTPMDVPDFPQDLWNATVFINETVFPALDIRVKPGAYSNTMLLGMNWTFVEYTAGQLDFQLNFENPLVVSSLQDDKDYIDVTIFGYPWFMDR